MIRIFDTSYKNQPADLSRLGLYVAVELLECLLANETSDPTK